MVPSKLYWLARYWNDLLQTHPNQWVALDDSGQLFVGDSRHDARQQAVRAGCIKPLTVYVAEDAWEIERGGLLGKETTYTPRRN